MAEAKIGVQKISEFVMTSAKASRRVNSTEATNWPISALDPSMILLNAVVEILAVPVPDIRAKLALNRARVTVMPVGGHPGRSDASHRFGRSKERLCRGHIAGLAQHHVYQRASAINRPVQITPSAVDFDVGFIDVPRAADPAATTPPATKIIDQRRRKLRLPIPNRLVGERIPGEGTSPVDRVGSACNAIARRQRAR